MAEVIEMPISPAVAFVPVAFAAVVKFRTVFPETVLTPEVEEMPTRTLLTLAAAGG